jgi:hypothetical protein
MVTSPASSKKTVTSPVPVVVRAISKPSHWRKCGSEPSSGKLNLSGGVALAGAANA